MSHERKGKSRKVRSQSIMVVREQTSWISGTMSKVSGILVYASRASGASPLAIGLRSVNHSATEWMAAQLSYGVPMDFHLFPATGCDSYLPFRFCLSTCKHPIEDRGNFRITKKLISFGVLLEKEILKNDKLFCSILKTERTILDNFKPWLIGKEEEI